MNDPTEQEIKGAAEKLATDQQFTASPSLMSIASELCYGACLRRLRRSLHCCPEFYPPAIRNALAVHLLSYSKSRVPGYSRDGVLAYASFWFRPILSKHIMAARESAEVNRTRASSGPVKVVVTNLPHSRRHTGVDLVSGTTALLARFPASWASKIAP